MLKKVMLGIVGLILLLGAENLLAKEKDKEGKPKATQQQKQVQKETKKQKSKAKRPDKKKAGKKATPKRKKASQKKRRQRGAKEAEAKKAKAEKARAEKVKAERARIEKVKAEIARAEKVKAAAVRKRSEQVRDKAQHSRPGLNPAAQQMFGRWLDELTKAYRENDREKMGQIIRRMHQLRQRVRQARASAAVRDLPDRGKVRPPKVTDRPSRRKEPESTDKPSRGRRREGTDRRKRVSPKPKHPER